MRARLAQTCPVAGSTEGIVSTLSGLATIPRDSSPRSPEVHLPQNYGIHGCPENASKPGVLCAAIPFGGALQQAALQLPPRCRGYHGVFSSFATLNNFTTTHVFRDTSDNYNVLLSYVPSNTPNGTDPQSGNSIQGFKWWNFTFPRTVDSGTNAVSDFENATNGAVNFGGTVGLMKTAGLSSTI